MNKILFHNGLILMLILFGFSQTAFCQKKNTNISPAPLSMYDTLSTQEMTKTQDISNSMNQRSIKLELGKIHLYYKATKFATLAPELREKINPKYIDSTEFEMDSLNSGKRVINFQLYLNYKAKGKFSIKDYK